MSPSDVVLDKEPEIPGYVITRFLGKGGMSRVYQATHGDRKCAIKVFNKSAGIVGFRQEASTLARINHPGVVKVFEVGETQDHPYIVMELVESKTLAQVLSAGPFPLKSLVPMAKAIAEILIEIHRKGLIHRDLKPANVMMESTGKPKIIDLGLAFQGMDSRRERNTSGEGVVGTFLYCSPEQIGMLKRPLDGRSDLYSLGCLLFECATGRVPYPSQNLNALLQSLATQDVPSPRDLNPQLPRIVSAIIRKLLAKDPSDRYFSALHLIEDLKHLEALENAKDEDLSLGGGGTLGSLTHSLELPLVGRAKELEQLNTIWKNARDQKGSFALIEGTSGSGKSRLARELCRRNPNALILAGKCTMNSKIPFGALRDALDDFIRRTRAASPHDRERIDEKLKRAIGEAGPFLKNISSELSYFLSTSGVNQLAVAQSQDLFFEGIAGFLLKLAHEFSPTLFLIDDVQWLDSSTRSVLKHLNRRLQAISNSKEEKLPGLLVLATARKEDDNSALELYLSELDHQVSIVQVGPLSLEATRQLIRSYLGEGNPPGTEFVERLVRASEGNALAISEYLRAMLSTGCLYPTWNGWIADFSEMEKLNLTSDVIQLMIRRISSLDLRTREVLRAASVLGSQFDQGILKQVMGRDVSAELSVATQANLLEESGGKQSFIHDRIQEALISELTTEDLKILHQRAAETLDALPDEQKRDRSIALSMARHYFLGYQEKNPGRCYDANLIAGNLALQSFSFQEAAELFQNASHLLETFALDRDETILLEARGEASTKQADDATALSYLNKALQVCKVPFQRARVYSRLNESYLGIGHFNMVEKGLHAGLAELGESMPKGPLSFILTVLRFAISGLFLRTTGLFFGKSRGDERLRILSRLHAAGMLGAMSSGNKPRILYLTLKQLTISHFLGPSPEFSEALSALAILFGGMRLRRARKYFTKRATFSADQLADPMAIAKVRANLVAAAMIGGDYLESEELGRELFSQNLAWLTRSGTLVFGGSFAMNLELRGHARDELMVLNRIVQPKERLHKESGGSGQITRMYSYGALGMFREAIEEQELLNSLGVPERSLTERGFNARYSGVSILLKLEKDEPIEAMEPFIERVQKGNANPRTMGLTEFIYYVATTYLYLRECRRAMSFHREIHPSLLNRFKRSLALLKRCNHPLTMQHREVGLGALQWFLGRTDKALRMLEHTEVRARSQGNAWVRFEAFHLRALIQASLGKIEGSKEEARMALYIAAEQGWRHRARKIQKAFQLEWAGVDTSMSMNSSQVLPASSSLDSLAAAGPRIESYQISKLKRQLDALLRLNRSSAQSITVNEHARTALDEVIQILNAERGFLLLPTADSQGLFVQLGRTARKQDVEGSQNLSNSIAERVRVSGRPAIFVGDQPDALDSDRQVNISESMVANRLRSVIATPLIKDDQLKGVLYLDSTVANGLFQEDDLEVLEAISGHLAVNLEAARTRQLETEKAMLQKEQELTELRLTSAHAAGMAEIATGIIHNIGNTLTSVVTNIENIKTRWSASKLKSYVQASHVLRENEGQLAQFVSSERGLSVLQLLIKLGDLGVEESRDLGKRLEMLESGIETIKAIVAMQQEYAKVGLHSEKALLSNFIEDVLHLIFPASEDQSIRIERDFAELPPVSMQKNKLLNVLVNLLNNAKDALSATPAEQRLIRVSTSLTGEGQCIAISDSGCGIDPENLSRIFSPGFSRRPGKRGMSLHMSANAMTEMGGSISAESSGTGKGATFTVVLRSSDRSEALKAA